MGRMTRPERMLAQRLTQFGFRFMSATPGTFYSTGGSPPFALDTLIPFNTNEPYDNVLQGTCDTFPSHICLFVSPSSHLLAS